MNLVGRWQATALGLPEHATFRCLHPIPGGVAAGSDYGMALYTDGAWTPFPFPAGARREARRVESLALHDGVLQVVTARNSYRWPFSGEAIGRGFPRDAYNIFVELRAIFTAPDGRLISGWRTHLDGGEGPPECIAFATDGTQVYAGTLDGRLHVVDGPEIRRWGAPVRYLAWHDEALWVAVDRGLHRLYKGEWTHTEGEPYALHATSDTLFALRQGGLWRTNRRTEGSWPVRLSVSLQRPWALTSTADALWVGEVGRLSQFSLR